MQVRLLGVHNLETLETRHSCYLIDDVLAVDAGSLSSALKEEALAGLEDVLLTHHHFDHIRDLPTIGLVRRYAPKPLAVHGLPVTLEGVKANLLNGETYPDLTRPLDELGPRLTMHGLGISKPARIGEYRVRAFKMRHPVPSVGYVVWTDDGQGVAFSGDTSSGIGALLAHDPAPQVLLVENTFPNRLEALARLTGHLTPSMLREELEQSARSGAPIPRVIVVHRSIGMDDEIARETEAVRQDLDVDIAPGVEGSLIDLGDPPGLQEHHARV
jgi:ribonuclease BN (tRNA processing enzyme)